MIGEIDLPDGPGQIVDSKTDDLPPLCDPHYVKEDLGSDDWVTVSFKSFTTTTCCKRPEISSQ